jgi:anti-sigma B factor antagonist
MVTIQHREIMEGRGAHVIVEGPLSGGAAVDLDAYVGDLMGRGVRAVVIDGGRMEFVSSAGLGAFVIINKKLRSVGGSLAVFSLNQETETLFRLLGFDREIPLVRDLTEAVKASAAPQFGPVQAEPRPRRIDTAPAGIPAREIPAEPPERIREPEKEEPLPAAASLTVPEEEPLEQSRLQEDPPLVFDNPIIVECRRCGSLVRVRQSGDYGCPDCNTEFTVMKDMTVVY